MTEISIEIHNKTIEINVDEPTPFSPAYLTISAAGSALNLAVSDDQLADLRDKLNEYLQGRGFDA